MFAAGLSPFNPAGAAVHAGRLMILEMRRYLAQGESFSFETTLSGRSYAQHIPAWQVAAYRVELIYLKLRSIRLALARVKNRVAQGGHHVPAAVVRRRFKLGWKNFEEVYRPLVDHWELYDNSGGPRSFLLREKRHESKTTIQDETRRAARSQGPSPRRQESD